MDSILTPQATQFLSTAIMEVLEDYSVSDTVATKISTLIVTKFSTKIIDYLSQTVRLNEVAIIKEAIEQCKNRAN